MKNDERNETTTEKTKTTLLLCCSEKTLLAVNQSVNAEYTWIWKVMEHGVLEYSGIRGCSLKARCRERERERGFSV